MIFFSPDVVRILVHKPVVNQNDFWCWEHNKSGEYSVRSGYWMACRLNKPELLFEALCQPSLNGLKKQIWSIPTEPKLRLFLWRASSDALPVAHLFAIRGMDRDNRCQLCGGDMESINHVLFTCSLARQVWALSLVPNPPLGFDELSFHSNLNYLIKMSKMAHFPVEIRRSFPWILWRIWKNRNSFCFEGKFLSPLDSIAEIKDDAEFWFLSQIQEHEDERVMDREEIVDHQTWKPPPPILGEVQYEQLLG